MERTRNIMVATIVSCISAVFLSGCGPTLAQPHELTAPQPIIGNAGKYKCPYTQDGVMAEWTDNAINAKLGSTIGKTAGAYVGQKALEQIPFIGGILGSAVGDAAGRAIAIEASGGWEFINSTSDLSFPNCDDMSLYLYVKCSSHPHFQKALSASFEIYPEMKKRYYSALVKASRNVTKSTN